MSEFLAFFKFFDEKARYFPMHLEIYYSEIMDLCISIYEKGCGENGKDLQIVSVQNCDMSLCFAMAHVKLKKWFLENEGGY